MTIDSDILEFLNTDKCKKTIMFMTFFIFLSMSITEIIGRPSAFLETLSLNFFVFWVGRASKKAERH